MDQARGFYPRQLRPRVRRDLEVYPAVAIMGARQVGKTTLSRDLARELNLAYLSLDERPIRQRALEDPEGLLETVAESGAVLDEVQRAPDLLLALKAVVDRDQRPGRFILNGSNQPRVSKHIADSLVGRVAYRTLRPLTMSEQRFDELPRSWTWFFEFSGEKLRKSLNEAAALNGPLDWEEATRTGGMPRVLVTPPDERIQMLDDYLGTFAARDIREVISVDAPERFERFFRVVAARTGQELNAVKMSRDLSTSVTTVRRWIDALERSYLVTLVPPYSRNPSARIIKSPKLFLVDSALALAGSRDSVPTGWQFETHVANDLLVWRDEAPGRQVSHWRSPSGPEVDFILEDGPRVVAVEVKTTEEVSRHDASHLALFLERHPEAISGVLLSSDPRIWPVRDRVIAAPWWSVI